MTLLYLVRHARSTWNAEGRWQGQADPPLDADGRQQAEALAGHLRGEALAVVYSSPLARARETAEILARAHDLPVRLDDRLKERDVGAWSGLTQAEVRQRYPEHFHANWWIDGPPGGEKQAELNARLAAVGQSLLAGHPEERVLVVSHGGSLNALLAGLLGLPPDRPVSFRFTNASLARVEVRAERVQVLSVGETARPA